MTFLPHRTTVSAVAVTVTCALALGACTSNQPVFSGDTKLATAGNSGTKTPDVGPTSFDDADVERKTQRAQAPSQLLVTSVRVEEQEALERVIFDFVGTGTPGWFIDYTENPSQQGSGNSIEFHGDVALNVNIDGTVLPFELNEPEPNIGTVEGLGGLVKEVISSGTFEGRSQFIIGLDSSRPYSVQFQTNPSRLVIDILNTTQK
ncbi:AMIN-like domain-containing (lipo)protein [Corynebacterium phocae]|nr:hypothetical protein [Corynebacterium phocae]KAA8721913.1 hypothetical protein F4V58_09535 [Corynebacterium phocae]